MSKIIEFKNISKDFKVWTKKKGKRVLNLFRRDKKIIPALNNISFEIEEGDIVGYIGPNGAFSSTVGTDVANNVAFFYFKAYIV